MSKSLHKKIIYNLLRASFPKFYNVILTGRVTNRLTGDIYSIDKALPDRIITCYDSCVLLVGIMIPLYTIGGLYYLPPLFGFIILSLIINITYLSSMRELTRFEAMSKSPIFSFFTQIIRGSLYSRTCISHKYIIDKHMNNIDLDLRNNLTKTGLESFYYYQMYILLLFVNLFQFFIALYDSNIGPDTKTQIYNQSFQISSNLGLIFSVYSHLQVLLVNFERCYKLGYEIELEPEIYEQQSQLNENPDEIKQDQIILFEQCQFKYRNDSNLVLKDFSFQIKKGQKIGVIGRTGAGKSTLILALSRIIDIYNGNMYINQQNSKTIQLSKLRKIFSVIPQEPFIFEGNLKQNLDPYGLNNDDQIIKIIKQIGLNNFQVFQNGGLNSIITNLGENLSIGEKQLISIARTCLRQAEIILIDEATSNIDDQVETLIHQAFNELFKNKTIIVIAHKIRTILQYNKILVIDSGYIKEFDSPKNLLDNPNSLFSEIIGLMYEAKQ